MLKKKILAAMLALLCTLSMVSCVVNDGNGEETTDATSQTQQTTKKNDSMMRIVDGEESSYKIICSESDDGWSFRVAEYISERISAATGVLVKVRIDDITEPSDYEIIVGETNRSGDLGFDAEAHNWERYPVHIGIYGTKLFITADKTIDVYKNLSFAMDQWLENAKPGELGVNEQMCVKMMGAIGNVSDDVITILSQNLCTWGEDPNTPAQRLERVVKEFAYYDPDIIGVQEQAPDDWQPYLPGALEPYGYAVLKGKKVYGGWDGDYNSIYYKAEKFNVIEWDTFWYSKTPDIPGTKLEGMMNWGLATWAVFEVKETNTRFVVLNTHLHAYEDYSQIRGQQIEMIKNFLEPYMSQYPVYVMGDMNIEETHTQYSTLLKTFYDSRDIAKKNLSGEQNTYNAFGQRESDADYIFTGKGDNQEVLWYKIINEKRFGDYSFGAKEWVSDHYGVYVQTRVS